MRSAVHSQNPLSVHSSRWLQPAAEGSGLDKQPLAQLTFGRQSHIHSCINTSILHAYHQSSNPTNEIAVLGSHDSEGNPALCQPSIPHTLPTHISHMVLWLHTGWSSNRPIRYSNIVTWPLSTSHFVMIEYLAPHRHNLQLTHQISALKCMKSDHTRHCTAIWCLAPLRLDQSILSERKHSFRGLSDGSHPVYNNHYETPCL